MTALVSPAYLAGSKGAPCTFRIPGACWDDPSTVVPMHIRDRHTGKAKKASDLSVGDGCFGCHEVFDRRAKLPEGRYLTNEEWLFYALRALQDTLERRKDIGLIVVAGDAELRPRREPAPRPRKPKAERRSIPAGRPLESRSTFAPKGSRPFPKKEKAS